MNVTGSGNGNALTVTLTDEDAQYNGATQTYQLMLPNTIDNLLGGTTAYVGFTGGNGGASSTQTISSFSYNNVGGSGPIVSGAATMGDAGNSVTLTGNATVDVGSVASVVFGPLSVGGNTLTVTNSAGDGAAATFGTVSLTKALASPPARRDAEPRR